MVTITQHASYGFDIREVDFGTLYFGISYTSTSTRFVINYGGGVREEYRGVGITYNATTGEPKGGTVHSYGAYAGATRMLGVDGLNIPVTKLIAVARTLTSSADDVALIKTALVGNDAFLGSNQVDYLNGFAGNDTIKGNGGNDTLLGDAGNDVIFGGAGNDIINGGIGNDTLKGEAGADTLTGGAGADVVFGGAGNDVFIFNVAVSVANRDTIQDFSNVVGNNDLIQIDNAVIAVLGPAGKLNPAFFFAGAAAHDANDHIVYNRATGVVFYDSNGNAPGGATAILSLPNKPALTVGDFAVI